MDTFFLQELRSTSKIGEFLKNSTLRFHYLVKPVSRCPIVYAGQMFHYKISSLITTVIAHILVSLLSFVRKWLRLPKV